MHVTLVSQMASPCMYTVRVTGCIVGIVWLTLNDEGLYELQSCDATPKQESIYKSEVCDVTEIPPKRDVSKSQWRRTLSERNGGVEKVRDANVIVE